MNPLKKITLVLLLIFLLPAIFYSAYEISSLNQDEEMINEIYQNQLDAILFSVNQFSDDIVKKWITEIETTIREDKDSMNSHMSFSDFLQYNPGIELLFMSDTMPDSENLIISRNPEQTDSLVQSDFYSAYSQTTSRLLGYSEVGYQKLEPIKLPQFEAAGYLTLVFILKESYDRKIICGIVLNPQVFIQEVLGPRLQTIGQDKFVLSAFREGQSNPVYSTADTTEITFDPEVQTKDLWFLPEYSLGITLLGKSIEKVVAERTRTNLVLILILDLILLLGVGYAYSNIRREIRLAQNKSDFVANVSHELRTPLALISMFAETLELGRVQTEEKKEEYYRIISKETQRLTGIVNKILSFSRRDANKKPLRLEDMDLNSVVEEVLETYSFHLNSNGYKYQFQPGDIPLIEADKEAISEVLINLLDNAMKYSDSEKKIEMESGQDGNNVFFSIKDTGIGISKTDQKHIFDKFYRVSTGDLANKKGTGLGLSLSKQIMDGHKGQIEVRSDLGKGSTFTLTFPRKD